MCPKESPRVPLSRGEQVFFRSVGDSGNANQVKTYKKMDKSYRELLQKKLCAPKENLP